jgi:hypothetical protein
MRGIGPEADIFYLGGSQVPFFCELVDGSLRVATDYDIRKAYGLNWATAVPAGVQLAVMKFHINVVGAADSDAWTGWSTILTPAALQSGNGGFKALGFFHDECSGPPWNVQAVLTSEVVYLGQVESGRKVYEVSFIEWKQPLPAAARPSQATPATGGGPPQAEDALGQEQLDATAVGQSLEDQIALQSDAP